MMGEPRTHPLDVVFRPGNLDFRVQQRAQQIEVRKGFVHADHVGGTSTLRNQEPERGHSRDLILHELRGHGAPVGKLSDGSLQAVS